MSKLLVIDGNALINIHFYGAIPADIRSRFYALGDDAEEKNRILGERFSFDNDGNCTELYSSLSQTILSYKRALDADALIVCFDNGRDATFRKALLPEYKAQRGETPFALKNTVEKFPAVLKELGIKSCRSNTLEADDLAGSIINRFKDECEMVYFVTKDHDWLQLVDRNVLGLYISDKPYEKQSEHAGIYPFNNYLMTLDGSAGRLVAYNKDVCLKEEGVYPEEIAFKKALAGDASDNYKGIHQIGEKAAIKLARRFHTPEALFEALGLEDSKSLGITKAGYENLLSSKETLDLMMKISTIKTDANINVPLDSLICNPTREDLERASEIFGFSDKIGQYNRDDYER